MEREQVIMTLILAVRSLLSVRGPSKFANSEYTYTFEQYEYLKKLMLDMGFELEFEDGVDKFRTLLARAYRFSRNQNGDYNCL